MERSAAARECEVRRGRWRVAGRLGGCGAGRTGGRFLERWVTQHLGRSRRDRLVARISVAGRCQGSRRVVGGLVDDAESVVGYAMNAMSSGRMASR